MDLCSRDIATRTYNIPISPCNRLISYTYILFIRVVRDLFEPRLIFASINSPINFKSQF